MGIGEAFEFEKTGRIDPEPVFTRPKLYFLVGVARSGKSTIANDWLNYRVEIYYNTIIRRTLSKIQSDKPRIVVNGDQIRLTLHGKAFLLEREPEVANLKDFITRLYLNSGYDVLIDGTHTTANSILKVLRIDNNADFYLIDTPIEECQRRAILSNQPWLITREVIQRMDESLKKWKDNPVEYINGLRKQVRQEIK